MEEVKRLANNGRALRYASRKEVAKYLPSLDVMSDNVKNMELRKAYTELYKEYERQFDENLCVKILNFLTGIL